MYSVHIAMISDITFTLYHVFNSMYIVEITKFYSPLVSFQVLCMCVLRWISILPMCSPPLCVCMYI